VTVHVEGTENMKNVHSLFGKCECKRLEDLGVGESMILKWMFYARRLGCSMISNYVVSCIVLYIL
jgi:hypothetical protein